VRHLPRIVIILTFLVHPTSSTAQLWKYLGKYDPKAALAFEKTLDSEACSTSLGSETYAGENSTYKIRTFCIRSFDGTRRKIVVSEIHHGHVLSIKGPGSSFTIDDISGLAKLHFLNPELLEIVYSPRGGSDQGFEYVMILGIKENRLCFVNEFLTINEYNIPDEYHLHEVRLKLQCQNLHDLQLTAHVRDVLKAGVHRSGNYDRKTVYLLRFDEKRKVFYTRIEQLNAAFRMNSSVAKPRLLAGEYPMVDLGPDEKYLYIDNTWYALTKDDSSNINILSKVH
jgi:hypothetical protein